MSINVTQRMLNEGKKDIEALLTIEGEGRDYNQWLYEQHEKFKSESQPLLTKKISKQEEVISKLDEEIADKDEIIVKKDNKIDELSKQLERVQNLLLKKDNEESREIKRNQLDELKNIKLKAEFKQESSENKKEDIEDIDDIKRDDFKSFAKKADEVDASIQRKDELVKGQFAKENK